MNQEHWTTQRIITVIIAGIGVIAAFLGWLFVFDFIPSTFNEEGLWTITMLAFVFTMVFLTKDNRKGN